MNSRDVFKKIGGILKELDNQYEYLQTVKDNLNDLELELFASNAHFLADHIEILSKLNLQNQSVKSPVEEIRDKNREEKFFEPVVQQMKPFAQDKTHKPAAKEPETDLSQNIPDEDLPAAHIDLLSGSQEDSYSFIRQPEPEIIRHELILDESENWDYEDEPVPAENEVEEVPDLKDSATLFNAERTAFSPKKEITLQDTNNHSAAESPAADKILTINQKMSAQADNANTQANQSAVKPISDIKLAITLNDKLLYVKDLFNGYSLAYSEAIEILNRFNTFEEATRFLNTNYVAKNNWESKPTTTAKFYALLKRRYA
jgi:hypothetical protein